MKKKLEAAFAEAERRSRPVFESITQIEGQNTRRVLSAFARHKINEAHLSGTTGYGYGDIGRDALEAVYSEVYGTEDALARIQIASGTHAISTVLFGILRPGDRVLCATGIPYDTILPTLGVSRGGVAAGMGDSLTDWGISVGFAGFDGRFNKEEIIRRLTAQKHKMLYIQRSRGYSLRPSLSSEEINALIFEVKKADADIITFVDNCYGEFVCASEPEADLLAGSLIKNAGGGLCPCGGYIAGKAELIRLCASRLTAAGIGKEVGASLGMNRALFTGLFMAPHITAQNLKSAVYAAALFEILGFETDPAFDARRADTVQLIRLGTPELLIRFCGGLQSGSPIDSAATPCPWDMPGYDCKVVMAAGGFISGSTAEISADAPLREPYAVWLQGGLTFESAKIAIQKAASAVFEKF